jgi:general secretion pathway protein A
LLDLSSFVISRFQKGLATVLVVDEAHHLSADVLEEIRLLTNLETPQEKLLQIVLVGQPELDEKLDSTDLRQLKQRIALRSQLGALVLDETEAYIHRRLQVAGSAKPEVLFPIDTILEVHRHSRGIPRVINTLCETGLIHGYAKQSRSVTPEMIEESAIEFRLNVVVPSSLERAASAEPLLEVAQAAKTLLDLYARLRSAQAGEKDLRLGIGARASEHEPYI